MFTTDGQFLTSFGKEGRGPGEFKLPRGLAVDDSGVVCVCMCVIVITIIIADDCIASMIIILSVFFAGLFVLNFREIFLGISSTRNLRKIIIIM